MAQREAQWEALQAAQRRCEEAALSAQRVAELRGRLAKSIVRCTCYRFEHWQGMWPDNHLEAKRLRRQGFHRASVCQLLCFKICGMERCRYVVAQLYYTSL